MSRHHPVELPTNRLPFVRTVRFAHYVRELVRQSVPFGAAAWIGVCGTALVASSHIGIGPRMAFGTMLLALVTPQAILITRLLWGTRSERGILFAAEATRQWRSRWREIQEASAQLQEKCRRQRSLFALPNTRRLGYDDEGVEGYLRPEELLAELPEEPWFVTFGNLTNQPIQVIHAGTREEAVAVARRITALVAGRLLGREIPLLVFKREGRDSIRLGLVTVVDPGSIHRAYLWATIHLQASGTTINGFVETVRTLYFGRGRCFDGYWHRGDEARAKGFLSLAGELLVLLTPLSLAVTPSLLKQAMLELLRNQVTALFYRQYRPAAGDTVDLFLIGQNGTDLAVERSFASHVEGVRSDLLQEVYTVTGLFAGDLREP